MDQYAAALLEAHAEIEEIVVFGSYAVGNYAPGSDLDVFILLSHSERSVRDRVPDFLPGSFPVGVDLFPYTRAEVSSSRASSGFLAEIQKSSWRYRRGGNNPNRP